MLGTLASYQALICSKERSDTGYASAPVWHDAEALFFYYSISVFIPQVENTGFFLPQRNSRLTAIVS